MRHLFLSNFAWFAVIFSPVLALSHGEDQPGPHGGSIRMPGAFHTEVRTTDKGFMVYLLDIQIQSPVVKESSVSAAVMSGDKAHSLSCTIVEQGFLCAADKPLRSKKGELVLKVDRQGAKGEAKYPLPLKEG